MTVVVLLTVVCTGIWTPDWISAGVLVSNVTLGDEMIFRRPWFSAAVSAAFRLNVLRMLPSTSEATVGPLPSPTLMPPATEFGKIRFVVFPWALSAFPVALQLMPRLRPRLFVVSTIRDSMTTWGVAVSRFSMSWRTAGRYVGISRMIRVFVRWSITIEPRFDITLASVGV